ncbi:MAG: hypothetical protein ACYTF1_12640 [Planctomycetota bacterium]|jgi:hypothetical protein
MYRYRIYICIVVIALAFALGCAGPAPRFLPISEVSNKPLDNGGHQRLYDTDANGKADYCERWSADNVLVSIGYDTDHNGVIDDHIELDKIPQDRYRHLVIILDSVPFSMVRDIWKQGRLRYFPPPSRVISPFPVMTDLSLSEFFGTSPCPGVESAYYDGNYLTNAYTTYLASANVAWKTCVDYRMNHMAHPYAYLDAHSWNRHELRRIQEIFSQRAKEKITVTYMVSTSALGARIGRNGHQAALIRLDRFCQSLMHQYRGRVRFTLFSDHGHALSSSKYIKLPEELMHFGYRVVKKLTGPGDVVIPQFGIVTCASLYTQSPAPLAHDLMGIEGIDLAAFLDDADKVMVLSRDGQARISRSAAGFSYQPDYGDPLKLLPVIEKLTQAGKADDNGFIQDGTLFKATLAHVYPDALYRLWRAFHGLIAHTPQVLVSVKDGWHCGSPAISGITNLAGAHGNLNSPSSSGFIMTSAGQLPPVMRMENAKEFLIQAGVPLKKDYPPSKKAAQK